MSKLYDMRLAAKTLLLDSGLWLEDEVIIKRRSNIWNDIATAVATSAAGRCIVIGTALGKKSAKQRQQSKLLISDVTLVVSIIETPDLTDPAALNPLLGDEDSAWEATVMALHGSSLGRNDMRYFLEYEGFDDVEDDQYVIRQTTFTTDVQF